MTPQSEHDVGLRALEMIHHHAMIDEEWTERAPRSFDWIGYRLRQSFESSPPFDDDGIVISRISVRVPVIEHVAGSAETVNAVLADLNRYAIGSAYVHDPETQSVFSVLRGVVHSDTAIWRSEQISSLGLCQLGQAETEADYLASALSGTVAKREHQNLGTRGEPDEMVAIIDSVFGRHGNYPSRFSEIAEFQPIAELANGRNLATSGASDTGITVEIPFAQDTSLIEIRSDVRHRRIGNGLAFMLRLPLELDSKGCAGIAGILNRKEACWEFSGIQYGA